MHQAKGDRFVHASELPVCDNDVYLLMRLCNFLRELGYSIMGLCYLMVGLCYLMMRLGYLLMRL